jgi:predicted MFS family arabinose efflux permease
MPAYEEKARSLMFLSLLCFALADVRDGLGPFLGVFLQDKGWHPDEIGYVMTAGGLAGMLCATPAGALADWTTRKRLLLGLVTVGIVWASGFVFLSSDFWAVGTSKIVQGALAAAIAPTMTGIMLGLVGQKGLPTLLGKAEAWNHFGNCSTALAGGVVGYLCGIPGVVAVLALMGRLVVVCLGCINPRQIDHAVARGLEQQHECAPSSFTVLLSDPGLLAVAGVLFFFHLGNAAMLPLLGQSAVARFQVNPAVYTAATIFVAQTTMIATSLWSAKTALSRGYGALFWVALVALPIRGMVACFYDSPWSVIPVQILDGVGAGLMGVATPGVVARLLQGTGRINMGLGFVLTAHSIGAALSSSYGGLFARHISYSAAFFMLALAPCLGLVLFAVAARALPSLAKAVSPLLEQ